MSSRVVRAALILAALAVASGGVTTAQPRGDVPEPLRPWVPWVLAEHPELPCPLVAGSRLCAWPGRLELDLGDRGGSFALEVLAERELDLPLPGDATHWPRRVTLDGAPALLRRTGDRPTVALPAGRHRVAGRFGWSRLPQSLAVPPEVGLVELRLNGESVARPRREVGGELWLAGRQAEVEAERVAMEVSRRIDDGVPVRLTVRLSLRVSGRARELDLGDALPESFLPTAVTSPLPARWAVDEGAGRRLLVQVRPGAWQITLDAVSRAPVGSIALARRGEPWPGEEFWVFAAHPAVRMVRLEGVPGVDPERTPLPAEWRSLPAFRVEPGQELVLTELRRGRPPPPPDSIAVRREWWLAEDGSRITARDSLRGTLNVGGRLETLAPAQLGRVALGEAVEERLITLGAASGRPGVEVRSERLDLVAELVYPRGGRLPAVGWDRSVPELSIRLNLPPGWQLLAAPGADRAAGALLDAWNLFDLFFLLLITLATARLSTWRRGALAFAILGLAWHEPYAPFLVFWWLLLLALVALLRVLPAGRAVRWVSGVRWVLAVAFALQLVLFCTAQWRSGVFPQLEHQYYGYGDRTAPMASEEFTVLEILTGRKAAMSSAGLSNPPLEGRFKRYEAPGVSSLRLPEPQAQDELKSLGYLGSGGAAGRSRQVDAAAVVQTGPGVPQWVWNVYSLSWSGPVSEDQHLRLLVISPAVERLLSLARIAGVVFLAFWLLDPRRHPGPTAERGSPGPGRTVALALLLLPLLATAARAQEPAPPPLSILQELERRLVTPPACHPECVELASLRLRARGDTVSIEAEVHAAAASAWTLPGPASAWTPRQVSVDGRPATALRRDAEGFLLLRLERGVHRVTLAGPAPDSLTLQLALPPRTLEWSADGWELAGYRPDAPPPASLRLSRLLPAAAPDQGGAEFAPRLELTRELDLGIPWLVHNRLERFGSAETSVAVEVPLLPGESVTTGGIPVEEGRAAVALERGETVRVWDSTLEEAGTLTLRAPAAPWLERWVLSCSPIWSCRGEGLAPTRYMEEGLWRPEWRPWPGESLTLRLSRPAPAPGSTTTLDRVRLDLTPGRRIRSAQLDLELRASQGGEQQVTLPAAAELEWLAIDGDRQPAQLDEGRLAFLVEPGRHEVSVAWREPHRLGLVERSPAVELGTPAANVTVEMVVPSNRWLLWAGGPRWGSEATIWLYLPLLAAGAWAFGRWRQTPLSVWDWLLLGLGLTQVHIVFAAVVVIWLAVFGVRDRFLPRGRWRRRFQYLLLGALWLAALAVLYAVVHTGLLGRPEMQVAGLVEGGRSLAWYRDLVPGALPRPWALWLPLWVFRVLMLLWALWLSSRLLRWLPWAWGRFVAAPEA